MAAHARPGGAVGGRPRVRRQRWGEAIDLIDRVTRANPEICAWSGSSGFRRRCSAGPRRRPGSRPRRSSRRTRAPRAGHRAAGRRDRAAAIDLGVGDRTTLGENLRFRLAQALADRAELEPAGSADRRRRENEAMDLLNSPRRTAGGLLAPAQGRPAAPRREPGTRPARARRGRSRRSPPRRKREVLAVRDPAADRRRSSSPRRCRRSRRSHLGAGRQGAVEESGSAWPSCPVRRRARTHRASTSRAVPRDPGAQGEQGVGVAAGAAGAGAGAGSSRAPSSRRKPGTHWRTPIRRPASWRRPPPRRHAGRGPGRRVRPGRGGGRLSAPCAGPSSSRPASSSEADAALSRVADDPAAGAIRPRAGMLRALARGRAPGHCSSPARRPPPTPRPSSARSATSPPIRPPMRPAGCSAS